jgi:VCBS repeat-containing protein
MTLARKDIEFLYQSLLFRTPEDEEIVAWMHINASGEATSADLQATIENSSEMALFVEPVIRLYQALLGRVPDPRGLDLHVNLLRSGLDITDIFHAMMISPEYMALHGQSGPLEPTITFFYPSLLGRPGSSSEIQAWMETGKPIEAIFLGFLQSDEFINRCAEGIARFLKNIAAGTEDYEGTLFDESEAKPNDTIEKGGNETAGIGTKDTVTNGGETNGGGTVTPVNTAPIARGDSYSLDEDTVLTVDRVTGLLANDSDADGGPLSVTLAAGPSHGSLALRSDGSFTYTPDADHAGTDSFSYILADGAGSTHTATVSLSIAGMPDLFNITGHSDGHVFEVAMAAKTGIVVFSSDASTMVFGERDTHQGTDLFLYDDNARSLTSITAGADSYSYNPEISADGARVVFVSNATNLVPDQDDTNPNDDIFLYDASERSITNLTAGADSYSLRPDISADGKRVVFISNATNLVPGQTDRNGAEDIFFFDTSAQTFLNLTHGANAESYAPRISADGKRVVFISYATNLVPGQTDSNGTRADLFLYDVAERQMRNLTLGADGDIESFDLSADGNWVVFASTATNLVPNQTDKNEAKDIFLYDTLSKSLTNLTVAGDADSHAPFIAANGSRLVFSSSAATLITSENDDNRVEDVFTFDLTKGALRNLTPDGDGASQNARLSGTGDKVVFVSEATNLVPGNPDTPDGVADIFLYDFQEDRMTNLTSEANADSEKPMIGDTGQQVLFLSAATNLTPGQINPSSAQNDLFFFAF